MEKPRIAFFFEHSYVENIPFIKEPILKLASDDFGIDLFSVWSKDMLEPNFGPYDVRVVNLNFQSRQAIPRILKTILQMALSRKYVLYIANPVNALIYAAIAALMSRVPLITFSDELYTKETLRFRGRIRDSLMKWANRRAHFTVVTDQIRAKVLRDTARLPVNHTFYELPNCVAGRPKSPDKRALRSRLNIPEDAILILSAGGLGPAMGSDVMLEALPRLPDNVYLIFQFWNRIARSDLEALCKLVESKYRVRFIFEPVPYDLMDQLVGSCDIGLAFYMLTDPNHELCGKGSGKLCRYLRLGKPAIVGSQGSIDWVARYGAGEIANSSDELLQAVEKIMANYQKYSEKALTCYEEHFAFDKYYPPIHEAIRQLLRQREVAERTP